MKGLNDAIFTIKESNYEKYFVNKVNFKDPLHEEILEDATLWANLLMDSLPSQIAEKNDSYRIIQEDILGNLIFELLDCESKLLEDQDFLHSKNFPYSGEAEQSVIGGLLLCHEFSDEVFKIISENDFYDVKHRIIFMALKKLAALNKPFDVVVVMDYLHEIGKLKLIGGEEYLYELQHNTPSAENVSKYAKIVREKSILRDIINASTLIVEMATNPEGLSEISLLNKSEFLIRSIEERHKIIKKKL